MLMWIRSTLKPRRAPLRRRRVPLTRRRAPLTRRMAPQKPKRKPLRKEEDAPEVAKGASDDDVFDDDNGAFDA